MLDNTLSKLPMASTHYRDGEVASDQDKVALTPSEHETLRAILGFVNFLCMSTKLDITLAINVLYGRRTAPTQLYMKQFKRLLRYLNRRDPWASSMADRHKTVRTTSKCSQTHTRQLTRPPRDRNLERGSCSTEEH
jgi:hypothetical protein